MYKNKEILRKELYHIHVEVMSSCGFDSEEEAVNYINSLTVDQLREELKPFRDADREMKKEMKEFYM